MNNRIMPQSNAINKNQFEWETFNEMKKEGNWPGDPVAPLHRYFFSTVSRYFLEVFFFSSFSFVLKKNNKEIFLQLRELASNQPKSDAGIEIIQTWCYFQTSAGIIRSSSSSSSSSAFFFLLAPINPGWNSLALESESLLLLKHLHKR